MIVHDGQVFPKIPPDLLAVVDNQVRIYQHRKRFKLSYSEAMAEPLESIILMEAVDLAIQQRQKLESDKEAARRELNRGT